MTARPPQEGEHIRIIADGIVTAYDPGSDAVQLDHEECWWPYSDAGTSVRYEVVSDARPPLDKHPISRDQDTRDTICWREHNPGYVCILPEGHDAVTARPPLDTAAIRARLDAARKPILPSQSLHRQNEIYRARSASQADVAALLAAVEWYEAETARLRGENAALADRIAARLLRADTEWRWS